MRHGRSLTTTIGLCLCLIAHARPAPAGDKAEARKHFETGLELLDSDDYEGAATEFEVSVEMYPTKMGLFNLANCLKALHRYSEALDAIERLKNLFKGKIDRKWREEIGAFTGAVEAVVGRIEVSVNLEGAAVRVDGREIGASPLAKSIALGPGKHEIEVSLAGHRTEKRTVRIVSGETRKEPFSLEQLSAELTIVSNVKGALVLVDGRKVGITPLSGALPLPVGRHEVRVIRDGYKPVSQTVQLEPGVRASLGFSLSEIVARAGPPAPIAREEPPATVEPTAAPAETAVEKAGEKGLPVLFWVGLGGAATSGILLGVFSGLAGSSADDFNKYSADYTDTVERIGMDPGSEELLSEEQQLYNEMTGALKSNKRYRNLAIASGIGMGAFVALAATALILDLKGGKEEPGDGMEILAAPGGVAVRF